MTPEGPIRFSDAEYARRRDAVLQAAAASGCEGFVGLTAAAVQWLTGYFLVPNERPFALYLDAAGLTLFTPLLKARHATLEARLCRVESYPEYPGRRAPLAHVAEAIAARRPRRLLLEGPGHASPYGYRGPQLPDLLSGIDCRLDRDLLERLRMVKSAEEIAVLRHACAWSLLVERELEAAVAAGRRESAVAGAATGAAMRALLARYADEPRAARPLRVYGGFGGQVGPQGSAHHAPPVPDPTLRTGDLLITQIGAFVAGYYADVERTLVVERPGPEAADLFALGEEIQDYALSLVGPGVPCAEIDRLVQKRYEARGIAGLWRHHVGHSLGLLIREAPYLDEGDSTLLEPGMVVTVEPGLYRDGVGGFRHSDTLLVTESGAEIMTPHPRDLASLCCG